MTRSLALILIYISSYSTAQEPKAADAAKQGLQDFQELVTTSKPNAYGLSSTQVSKAELKDPLPVYLVQRKDLASFNTDIDPSTLLIDLHSYIYPISVAGSVKSGMEVNQRGKDSTWKMVAVGSSFIKDVLKAIAQVPGVPTNDLKLIQIPAMNLYFVGWSIDKDIKLIPIYDSTSPKFKAGETISARSAFAAIRPQAQQAQADKADAPR